MTDFVELKDKNGKYQTCSIGGKNKKIYVDRYNTKTKYVKHNKDYIPKDEFKKLQKKQTKKRKQRGGTNNINHYVIILHKNEDGTYNFYSTNNSTSMSKTYNNITEKSNAKLKTIPYFYTSTSRTGFNGDKIEPITYDFGDNIVYVIPMSEQTKSKKTEFAKFIDNKSSVDNTYTLYPYVGSTVAGNLNPFKDASGKLFEFVIEKKPIIEKDANFILTLLRTPVKNLLSILSDPKPEEEGKEETQPKDTGDEEVVKNQGEREDGDIQREENQGQ